MEGVTDRPPGAQDEGDAGHGGQSRRTDEPARPPRHLSMSASTPTPELDARYGDEGVAATPWATVEQALTGAELYWLTTVRAAGGPHMTPLIGVYADGALHFCTGRRGAEGPQHRRQPGRADEHGRQHPARRARHRRRGHGDAGHRRRPARVRWLRRGRTSTAPSGTSTSPTAPSPTAAGGPRCSVSSRPAPTPSARTPTATPATASPERETRRRAGRRTDRPARRLAPGPADRRPAGRRWRPPVRAGRRDPDARRRRRRRGVVRGGVLTWNGHELPVTRRLVVRRGADGWTVCFDDGRPFHPWSPGTTGRPRVPPRHLSRPRRRRRRPPDDARRVGRQRAGQGPPPVHPLHRGAERRLVGAARRARLRSTRGLCTWNDRSPSSPTRACWPMRRHAFRSVLGRAPGVHLVTVGATKGAGGRAGWRPDRRRHVRGRPPGLDRRAAGRPRQPSPPRDRGVDASPCGPSSC